MTEKREPKFGTAFNAAASDDWMITESGFRRVLAGAARLLEGADYEKAVEAYPADRLENTPRVSIREGVAIIKVTGTIMRYADWMSYYCGGSSIASLAKDFRATIDNPNVYAILFEIDSPGGQVTGVNEFCEMIYAARGRKPMTARVGGLACSAAYWVASACGDIVIDETAQLGSIGVMTTYLDDRKQMEMRGLEEIPIISSQSPFKNSPPTSDEGLKRIQTRIDALARVFVEKVARNRDVQVTKVLKDFGQGDVMVGQDAIDAGLADRLGSFEEALALLSKTHAPHLYSGERAAVLLGETLNFPDAVNSAVSAEELSGAGEQAGQDNSSKNDNQNQSIQFNEETMSEENKTAEEKAEKENAERHAPAVSNTSPDAAKNMDPEKEKEKNSADETPDEESARADNNFSSAAANPQTEIARLRAELAERDRDLIAEKAAVKRNEMAKIAADFAGNKEEKAAFLFDLADKFGEDSAQFKNYVTDQKALSNQKDTAKIFEEQGAPIGASDLTAKSAEDRLDALAQTRAEKDQITFAKAYSLIVQENQELYRQYDAESNGAAE